MSDGLPTSRHIDDPQPGFFKLRLVRGGPWVPAAIYRTVATDPVTGEPMDRSPVLWAEINGRTAELIKVWHWGRFITKDEFDTLSANAFMDPTKALNLGRTAPLF